MQKFTKIDNILLYEINCVFFAIAVKITKKDSKQVIIDKNAFEIKEGSLDFKIKTLENEVNKLEYEMDILYLNYDYEMLKIVKERYNELLIELYRLYK